MIDLHTHSYYSDGTYSPAELIDEARHRGLSAIALSDHNTIRGLEEFLAAAQDSGIEAIPGVEFSTDYLPPDAKEIELHILALFVRPEYYSPITDMVSQMAKNKEQSNRDLVAALCAEGYNINYDEVCASSCGNVNRAHIAAILTERGYTPSIQSAFQTLLSPDHGLYIPPRRLPVFETLAYIRSIGAVAVLAHPFLRLSEQQLRVFLPKATEYGLVGMETLYSTYDEKTTALSRDIAREYGLCESGGSDFHGARKPDITLGTGRGNLAIPYEFLEKLKQFAH